MPCVVLKNHETFCAGLSSLLKKKKEFVFFDKDHHDKKQMNRPVLLHSSTTLHTIEDHLNDCHRSNVCLIEMKMNHVYNGQQLPLWIVTRSEPTNMIDGTIYLIVRDQFDAHIRLGKFSIVFGNHPNCFYNIDNRPGENVRTTRARDRFSTFFWVEINSVMSINNSKKFISLVVFQATLVSLPQRALRFC